MPPPSPQYCVPEWFCVHGSVKAATTAPSSQISSGIDGHKSKLVIVVIGHDGHSKLSTEGGRDSGRCEAGVQALLEIAASAPTESVQQNFCNPDQ